MLALADLRSPEQIEADTEIARAYLDERNELTVWFQRAAAETAAFVDYWYKHNNLPRPPSPFDYVMEMLGRDLVAEATHREISRQTATRRRRLRAELSVLASETQLSLL